MKAEFLTTAQMMERYVVSAALSADPASPLAQSASERRAPSKAEVKAKARKKAVAQAKRRKARKPHGKPDDKATKQFTAVVADACVLFKFNPDDMRSKKKEGGLAFARHALYWIGINRFGLTTVGTGRVLRKDHSSVIYGRNKAQAALDAAGTVPPANPLLAVSAIVEALEAAR